MKDVDDETAHIDNERPKIIHFTCSSSNADFMIDKVLKPDQGLTFDLFKEEQKEEGDNT